MKYEILLPLAVGLSSVVTLANLVVEEMLLVKSSLH